MIKKVLSIETLKISDKTETKKPASQVSWLNWTRTSIIRRDL